MRVLKSIFNVCVCVQDSLRLTTLDGGKDRAPGRGFEEDGEEEDMFEAEFRQYKRTYYMTKMGVEVVSELVYLISVSPKILKIFSHNLERS